ncbi:hypothetical protein RD792_001101 [Penstemon davidsonii]|uniref:Uncharacterized protein n=1 Tax=Penstemon davidsonii TaxID=160366 RepID=A0ABR0DMT9_9LAMI|nr:hypothetical protein RD792_001101 [Penstemon davidsonii]
MSLPQTLKKWQDFEGRSHVDDSSSSSYLPSLDNTQTSIPNRPYGFAESFTSADGRGGIGTGFPGFRKFGNGITGFGIPILLPESRPVLLASR